jgi:hypothetical protein
MGDFMSCITRTGFDLSLRQKQLENWVGELRFDTRQQGIHFKKHGKEHLLVLEGVKDSASYLATAQKIVKDCLLENGHVMRLGNPNRVAFFKPREANSPIGCVVILNLRNYQNTSIAKISTFYSHHGLTPANTARNFSTEAQRDRIRERVSKELTNPYQIFITTFEMGKSQGWYSPNKRDFYLHNSKGWKPVEPSTPLHPALDFLSVGKTD